MQVRKGWSPAFAVVLAGWLTLAGSLAPPVAGAKDANALAPTEALAHVGDDTRVCGQVASAKFAHRSRGQPTFLNLQYPYPNHVFTALIWGEDRAKFAYAPERLRGRRICVVGIISTYRGRAQIVVHEPSQIETR